MFKNLLASGLIGLAALLAGAAPALAASPGESGFILPRPFDALAAMLIGVAAYMIYLNRQSNKRKVYDEKIKKEKRGRK